MKCRNCIGHLNAGYCNGLSVAAVVVRVGTCVGRYKPGVHSRNPQIKIKH